MSLAILTTLYSVFVLGLVCWREGLNDDCVVSFVGCIFEGTYFMSLLWALYGVGGEVCGRQLWGK
jgi:hypothetical protein